MGDYEDWKKEIYDDCFITTAIIYILVKEYMKEHPPQ